MIDYKFNEGNNLKKIKEYIDSTYDGYHYSKNRIQTTEFIADSGHLTGFAIGNIIKYAQRYGLKGSNEDHVKDIMKIIHYSLILLNQHTSNNLSEDWSISDQDFVALQNMIDSGNLATSNVSITFSSS